jgi:hypothetical protein
MLTCSTLHVNSESMPLVTESDFKLSGESDLISMTQLKRRGWSSGMVIKLLGQPVATVTSRPGHRDRRLWSATEAYEWEVDPRFETLKKQKSERAIAATHALAAARNAALRVAREHDLAGIMVSEGYAKKVASIVNDIDRQSPLMDDNGDVIGWETFLVYHFLSSCKHEFHCLDDFAGKPGVMAAREALARRILDTLFDSYPEVRGYAHPIIDLAKSPSFL